MQVTRYLVPLIIAITYIITFWYILPCLCQDKIYSAFYRFEDKDSQVAARAYRKNLERLREATLYLNSVMRDGDNKIQYSMNGTHNGSRLPRRRDKQRLSIAAGVVSVQRTADQESDIRLGYLTQVIASLHRQAAVDVHFDDIDIFICNVDNNGNGYEEASRLSELMTTYVKYKDRESLRDVQESWQIFEKEKRDYQFCLETSLLYDADYIVILEDDAVPKTRFFSILYRVLQEKVRGRHHNAPVTWAFIKLYYPEKWSGYGFELRSAMELLCFGLISGILFDAGYIVYQRVVAPYHNRMFTQAVVFFCGAFYAPCLMLAVGRPYIIELMYDYCGWYWVVPSRRCCTQAVVYPAAVIPDLIKYMSNRECDIDYSVDLVLENFVTDGKLNAFLVEPNIINHIGMFSSLRPYAKRPGEFI